MNPRHVPNRKLELLSQIAEFIAPSSGLDCKQMTTADGEKLIVRQAIDGKAVQIFACLLEDVLLRIDAEGQRFIQVNFSAGEKILVTSSLIGFKPAKLPGLNPARLPRVVTTPDVLSIFEAIQESLEQPSDTLAVADDENLSHLRKLFEAVLAGGEQAGFNLSEERRWLSRIPVRPIQANA